MKNLFPSFLIACLAFVSMLSACKTDLDVNAPYKNVTIVYALLDKDEDTSWIKINKAFLGEGDAFQYAQIPDSNEYSDADLHAYVEELNPDGSVFDTLTLHSKLVDRDPGIFYGPQHKLYWFRGSDTTGSDAGHLNPNQKYRLKAVAKGTAIEAVTGLVQDISIYAPVVNTNQKIQFATAPGTYTPYEIKWTTGAGGKRFDVSYTFYYYEATSATDSVLKSYTNLIGTRTSTGIGGGEQSSVTLNGESFYQAVRTNVLAQSNANVLHRNFVGIDILWAVAGPDLYTYLQLSNPISGIVEERPEYSNIQNGYGLFSSRLFDKVSDHPVSGNPLYKQLNNTSLAELKDGQYTNDLGF